MDGLMDGAKPAKETLEDQSKPDAVAAHWDSDSVESSMFSECTTVAGVLCDGGQETTGPIPWPSFAFIRFSLGPLLFADPAVVFCKESVCMWCSIW